MVIFPRPGHIAIHMYSCGTSVRMLMCILLQIRTIVFVVLARFHLLQSIWLMYTPDQPFYYIYFCWHLKAIFTDWK